MWTGEVGKLTFFDTTFEIRTEDEIIRGNYAVDNSTIQFTFTEYKNESNGKEKKGNDKLTGVMAGNTITIPVENGEMVFNKVRQNSSWESNPTGAVVLNVHADGGIEGKDKVVPGAAVLINADNDTPMGVVNDLKQWLREVGGLKIYYSRPTETESVMRHIAPSVTNKTLKVATYDEALKGINRTDICVARINANDKIFFESGAYDKDADILRIGKAFLKEHGTKTVFTLTYDRSTSYGTYLRLQTLLSQIYNEVRDDKAREVYGNSLSALTEEQRSAILKLVPMAILETDMKG